MRTSLVRLRGVPEAADQLAIALDGTSLAAFREDWQLLYLATLFPYVRLSPQQTDLKGGVVTSSSAGIVVANADVMTRILAETVRRLPVFLSVTTLMV